MISFHKFKEKELHLLPLRWLAWLSPLVIIAVLGAIFLGPSLARTFLVDHARIQVCTVSSADLSGDFAGGSPTNSLRINTSCGILSMSRVSSPEGVNQAKVDAVLNNHKGEKFEFLLSPLGSFNGVTTSYGLTSLNPVE